MRMQLLLCAVLAGGSLTGVSPSAQANVPADFATFHGPAQTVLYGRDFNRTPYNWTQFGAGSRSGSPAVFNPDPLNPIPPGAPTGHTEMGFLLEFANLNSALVSNTGGGAPGVTAGNIAAVIPTSTAPLSDLFLQVDVWANVPNATFRVVLENDGVPGGNTASGVNVTLPNAGTWYSFYFNVASMEASGPGAYNPSGSNRRVYVNSTNNLEHNFAIDNLYYGTVPEPGSLALLGAGGLLMLRRGRRA